MGVRLHSAKVYDVQYNDCGRFNYAQEYVNPIIDLLSENEAWFDNPDYVEGSSVLEVSIYPFKENLEHIITPNNEWEYQEGLEDLIKSMEQHTDIDRNYLYEELKKLVDLADKGNNYVHFSWF